MPMQHFVRYQTTFIKLTRSVNLNKAVVLYGGSITDDSHNNYYDYPGNWDARLVLAAANKVTVTRA